MSQTVTLALENAKVDIPLRSLLEQIGSTIKVTMHVDSGTPPVPKIGEYWHGQGGICAGIMRGHGGKPDYHLILAVDSSAKFDDIKWGGYGTKIDGADDQWDGQANTQAILRANGTFPAAELATTVRCDGHTDFYLPSKRESALLYANLPDQFESGWHWTSTQVSAYSAAIQNFLNGSQSNYVKDDEFRVRVVRRLTI
ncbi:hypothetical protein W822_20165 [Advenella kashmirensis W13003]|uniref:DUF1566 domain-containing protein n=1 Tax=Advenella kashmirensis W13003 TaxID=1424334 RepID=V8QL58_9BURK|nr:DUF1566 domain-containing protein [Advenella kashmirensis]ETF00696.1 hypothetical protein W822_20165 [Advenella kashmirensis W13003]